LTPKLRAQLRQIRAAGFSVAEGEIDAGVRGVAVPLFNPDQSIDGSLSVVAPISRTDIDFLAEHLTRGRKAIEAGLALLAARSSPSVR
jgi:DNA-binding IclR family transcriptional regulator